MPGGRLTKAQAEQMAPIGNSPTFLSLRQMKLVMPLWANVSIAVFKDKDASEVCARPRPARWPRVDGGGVWR